MLKKNEYIVNINNKCSQTLTRPLHLDLHCSQIKKEQSKQKYTMDSLGSEGGGWKKKIEIQCIQT